MRSGRFSQGQVGYGPPRSQAGYTYVAMLIAVAVLGVGLAATGMVWSQASQREKELELLFIGDQFRQAIKRYYESTPGDAKRYPQTLDELVADQRFAKPERHLRRIYTDPMTGKAEWGLMEAPGGGIMGVYSRSNATPIKNAGFRERDRTIQGATNYYEWRFFHEEAAAGQETATATQVADTAPATQSSSGSRPSAMAATPSGTQQPVGNSAQPARPAQNPAAAPAPGGIVPRTR